MPILKRRCPVDGTVFDLLEVRGELSALNHDDLDHLGCPVCGAEGESVIAGFLPKDLGGQGGVSKDFPYFDRGLGCVVNDAKHRRWLLEHYPDGRRRPEKLIPTDGDFDFEEIAAEQERSNEKIDRAHREQQEYMEHGPDRAAYARIREIMSDPKELERLWGE